MLDRAWLRSIAKFLLTGLILAAFWLIARFSGSWLRAMHFRDELMVLLAVGGTISTRSRSSCCSDASGA